jgi:putative ABC transport system permease protein
MMTFFTDLRYAWTTAVRAPALTLAAAGILALGVGTTTAVFSVVDAVLLRALPYHEDEGLVRLYEERAGATPALSGHLLSSLTYVAWRDGGRTLAGLTAFDENEHTVLTGDVAERLAAASVTPSFFTVMREAPALGRFFTLDEEAPGAAPVAVLSDRFWRERFGADAGVVGRTLLSDGVSHTVVGVARAGFAFPADGTAFWTVKQIEAPGGESTRRKVAPLQVLGRLADGVTAAQAAEEGTAIARATGPQSIESELLFGAGGPPVVRAVPLLREVTAPVRPALAVVSAGVLLVLLVACANVATLLLSRGMARQYELAVRATLGASRWRLTRQLLTESLVWCGAGGVLGIGLAWLLVRGLTVAAPADLPRFAGVGLNWRVVATGALITLIAAVLSALLPGLRGGATEAACLTVRDGGTWAAGRRSARWRDLFLIGQATFAVVLVVGTALVAHSFVNLTSVDAGYDARDVLTARLYVPGPPERGYQLMTHLLQRLRGLPGVAAAGGGNMMPFSDATYLSGFGMPSLTTGEPILARAREHAITPGYGESLGLELVEGRFFDATDSTSITPALVNETFARLYLLTGPVAGRLIQSGLGSSDKPTVIVGVVRDVRKERLDETPQPDIYLPLRSGRWMHEIVVVVRVVDSANGLGPALITALVHEADPTASVAKVTPLASLVSASVAQPRFTTMVMSGFASMGLAVAATGLYGALSFVVGQRRRELGIRAALGADRQRLLMLILRHGFVVVTAGAALGCAVAWWLARLLGSTLFGMTSDDPVSYAVALALFVIVALAACLRPALRAAATDPAETLKQS